MKPLNLPPGSVRSIVTLLLIGSVCAVAVWKGSVPAELSSLGGMALAFYFRVREDQKHE